MISVPPRQFSGGKFFHRLQFWLLAIALCTLMLLEPGISAQARAGLPEATPVARATAIVQQMTLDEKIEELHGVGGSSPNIRIVPAIPRLHIPAFVITNGPDGATNGTVKPVPPATAMPVTLALAASWDTNQANTYGTVVGNEAKILGNDLIEGPDMNLARIPQGGRTFENLGEDPFLAGQMAVSDIQGIQSQGEIAEAKHYAGNEQEANRFNLNDTIDERTLQELYLAPFEASVVQGHVGAVMCAYPRVNGTYSCENSVLLNQILKGSWNFSGIVTSDFGAVHSTVPSALNGLDLEMPSGVYFGSALKAAVLAGQVPMSVIDDKLIRRFSLMMEMGLWDNPPVATPISSALAAADGAKARTIAEEGMVLLKNSHNLLPLSTSSLKSIALIGGSEWAGKAKTGGGGSSAVVPLYTVNPLQGLQNRAGSSVKVTYNDGSDLASAEALAKTSSVAIVMVGDSRGEGHDTPISLSGNQDALVSGIASANKNTIVVVKSGSAVLMPWVNQVPAIVEAWYPGEEDGNAVAGVLFGDFNPSGKLPMTFPASLGELPANTPSQYPAQPVPKGTIAQAHYSEGLDMGYRYYDANNLTPLFPFGFGLSYTTFKYSNLQITAGSGNSATVTFNITNTGSRMGGSVAEVYVGMPTAAGEPPKVLAGFTKLSLKPGQTGQASVTLNARAFEHWNTGTHNWAITPGTYHIQVGSSSRDILLQGQISK
ncbi:MAG: glycoside hydrolase family 3 C-terminal domain-containing protein [Ktedonobacteraceae bacterium]|nr:glycoside hydrolase family 3 C-terminal domain-containing protein [Ktedonobacteraceae bacterium]MBV9710308.1 glycoside hydrolase family 3 C-terminal domain-containing protein [Ktedonobacteraceae bacterium]